MNAVDIEQMSVLERLKFMELIWTSLLNENVEVQAPDWHDNILSKRKKLINAGEAKFISIDDLRASFDKSK